MPPPRPPGPSSARSGIRSPLIFATGSRSIRAAPNGVAERYAAMLAGEHINTTEDRAVLHTALRRPAGAQPALVVDGQDIDADVQSVLSAMTAFADRVRSGEWKGVTGKKVTHIVNIGIGGSDLG